MSTAFAPAPPQAIAGVSPAEISEVTVMTVWPSNASYALGRWLGRLYGITWPNFYFFRLGHLFALASIPIALVLFFMRIAPGIGRRYTLTNRRVIVQKGISLKEEKSVELGRFDAVDIVVQPGQEWYDAGDLVFRLGNIETFRLEGVSRPDAFRATLVKSQMAHSGVKRAVQRERR